MPDNSGTFTSIPAAWLFWPVNQMPIATATVMAVTTIVESFAGLADFCDAIAIFTYF
jgi:hypothetical protein